VLGASDAAAGAVAAEPADDAGAAGAAGRAVVSITAGLGSTGSDEAVTASSPTASSPFFFFFFDDFAVLARFLASTTSTFSAVSTAVPPVAPENHSRMVSDKPTETVEAALVTPSICSRWHFSTTSLLVTPSSLASWLILILLPLGVLNRCSFCGGSGQSLLVWMMLVGREG
jgi:hypothetical protein